MIFRSSHSSPISKVNHEDTTLFLVLKEHFALHFNKAIIKLISMFILSLLKYKQLTLIDYQIHLIRILKVNHL